MATNRPSYGTVVQKKLGSKIQKNRTMKYILIQQPGFKERFLENLETFKAQTSEELIDLYNSSVKTGIVGVYAQAIMLVALRHEIKRRFGVSPILLEDNMILSLTRRVEIRDGDLVYEDGGEVVT